jgi:hypothetical protein
MTNDTTREVVEALEPCPFCGCLAWLHTDPFIFSRHMDGRGSTGHRIECEGKCHAMTCWWHTKEEAVTHWNMRTPAQPAPSTDEVEEIRARHDECDRQGPLWAPSTYAFKAHADRATLLRLLDAARAELASVREAAESRRGSLLWWVDAADAHAEYLSEQGYLIDADHWEHIRRLAAALKAPLTRAQGESS